MQLSCFVLALGAAVAAAVSMDTRYCGERAADKTPHWRYFTRCRRQKPVIGMSSDFNGFIIGFPKWLNGSYLGLVNVTFQAQVTTDGSCSPDDPSYMAYVGVFRRTNSVCSAASAAMLSGPVALLALAVAAWRLSFLL